MRLEVRRGSSVEINFDRTFGKTGHLRYRTTIYSFYGWITDISQQNRISDYTEYRRLRGLGAGGQDPETKPRLAIHPTVRWTNTVDIKATKFLDDDAEFPTLL